MRSHGLPHARHPCPSLSPRVCSNSCPLSLWCHPTISSSVTPFSSCPQCFPESGSFPMSLLFASVGQRIGTSSITSVLPMSVQDFPLGPTGLTSLQSKRLSRVLTSTTIRKHWLFHTQPSLWSNSHGWHKTERESFGGQYSERRWVLGHHGRPDLRQEHGYSTYGNRQDVRVGRGRWQMDWSDGENLCKLSSKCSNFLTEEADIGAWKERKIF